MNQYNSSSSYGPRSDQNGFGVGKDNKYQSEQAAAIAYKNSSVGLSSKRPNPNLHNGATLTNQERKVKAKMEESGTTTNHISKQAFKRPDGWDEKVNAAIEYTITDVMDQMEKKERNANEFDSDESFDGHTPIGVDQGGIGRQERANVTEYIRKLADFHPLTCGFHVVSNHSE